MEIVFILAIFIVLLPSFIVLGKRVDISGFYLGLMDNNKEPSFLTLTFSLATSWIFSRSLLTAAILAYYYSFPGAIAYSLYYFSFLTGVYFIIKVRKKYVSESVVSYFYKEFGQLGKLLYTFLIALRLLSEIFANLIVVGLIFGDEGSLNYKLSIIFIMLIAFSYSSAFL